MTIVITPKQHYPRQPRKFGFAGCGLFIVFMVALGMAFVVWARGFRIDQDELLSMNPIPAYYRIDNLGIKHNPPKLEALLKRNDISSLDSLFATGSFAHDGVFGLSRACPNLTQLIANDCAVGDVFVREELSRLRFLRWVELNKSAITDESADSWPAMRNVRNIKLRDTSVSDRSCRAFAKCPVLILLDLSGTKVGDVGMVELSSSKTLKMLLINRTAITDDALLSLRRMPSLDALCVRETNVSRSGVEQFRKSRPDVELFTDH